MEKVVVIAPHPDDETLGCGGTLLKHIQNGDKVYWLVITEMNIEGGFSKEQIIRRKDVLGQVNKAYGFAEVCYLQIPTCNVHNYDFNDLLKGIGDFIKKIEPTIVYGPNRSDVHTDHQIIAKSIWGSTKAFRYPSIKKVFMYETLSETEYAPPFVENIFIPNVFVDISEYLNKKLEIMQLYEGEVQSPPFPRSLENIKALATFRGSSVNVLFAEAFMLVREVI